MSFYLICEYLCLYLDSQTEETANNVKTLHDVALLNSGFNLKDTSLLSDRINRTSLRRKTIALCHSYHFIKV